MPRWVAERARDTRSRVIAVEDDMQISFYFGIMRALEDLSITRVCRSFIMTFSACAL